VPRTLRDILLARIAVTRPSARGAMRVIAVAGHLADDSVITSITGLPIDELEDGLRDAIDRQVLVVDRETGTYRFRHALVAELVYGDLLPGERRRLHAAVAEWLTARGGEAAAELAHHWYAARRPKEAIPACLGAAQAATRYYAHADALRDLEQVLEMWWTPEPEALAGISTIDLLMLAADTADRASQNGRALELADAALELVDEDGAGAGGPAPRPAGVLPVDGLESQAADEHRIAVRLVPADPPTVDRALVLGGLASTTMAALRYRESKEVAEEALGVLRAVGSREGEPRLHNILGVDLVGLGEIEAGLAQLREAVSAARDVSPIESRVGIEHNLCYFLSVTDHLDEALEATALALADAQRTGLDRKYGAGLRAIRGDVLFRLGRWDEAAEVTRTALDGETEPSKRSSCSRSGPCSSRPRRSAGTGRGDPRVGRAGHHDVDPDVRAYYLGAVAEQACCSTAPATRCGRSRRRSPVRRIRRAAPHGTPARRGHDRRGRPGRQGPGLEVGDRRCRGGDVSDGAARDGTTARVYVNGVEAAAR
jgi:tetratricopeptide (TPR) repeat protein